MIPLTPRLQQAINLATKLHDGQTRKGDGLPYILHPFSVAWLLASRDCDEDVVIAGLMHDVLEDVPEYSFVELEKDFGEKIARIVKDVSEDKDPRIQEDEKATWLERKRKYLEHLAGAQSDALLVSAADKLHNLRSMRSAYATQGPSMWEKFNSPLSKRLWFYEEVLGILQARLESSLVEELESELAQFQKDLA